MFLQLKSIIFREFCSLFSEEAVVISGDNKCKIPLGLPCVNRLNTLNKKFFLSDSMPEYPDHDHRSGNLINPEGYMFLQFHDEGFYEDDEEELVQEITSPGGIEEEAVDVDHNDETQYDLPIRFDVSDDDQNAVEVLDEEGGTPDTTDDRQASVDDSIVEDNVDDMPNLITDLAFDSQDLVEPFGYSEVNDNILSQLDGADSSESDMDEVEEFDTVDIFRNRSKRPRLAPFIQISESEEENSDSDRHSGNT